MESFLGVKTTSFLQDQPEDTVYKLLIDSYRLRMEDEYVFKGDVYDDSLYGGGDPVGQRLVCTSMGR
jgi:mitochondrial splicing suppressor protein 51